MGDEKRLLDEILSDAKAKAERVRKRAEREVRAYAEETAKRLEEEMATAEATSKGRLHELEEHARIEGVLRRKRECLRLREEAVDALVREALASIVRERGEAYRNFLTNAIRLGVDSLAPGDIVAYVSKIDRTKAHAQLRLPAGTKLRVAEGNVAGGAVVEDADGRRRCDLSLDGLRALHERRLRTELSEILFGEEKIA